MKNILKLAVVACLIAIPCFATGESTSTDVSTVTYSTGFLTYTTGVTRLSWSDTPYTNLAVVEIQLKTTALSISCRVHKSVFTFKTNDVTAATVNPWNILSGTATATNMLFLPISTAAKKEVEIWNPTTSALSINVKLR